MRPKEIQEKLGIDAERIKLFKRESMCWQERLSRRTFLHISQRKITMTGRSIDRGTTMRRLCPERFIMQPII